MAARQSQAGSDGEDLRPSEREVLRGLLRGASVEDLGWAMDQSGEELLATVNDALAALDPELARSISPVDRRRIVDYTLSRQSPGQAAGTWELLERSADARRWALWIRECIGELFPSHPPPLPGLEERPTARAPHKDGRLGKLGARRRERERRRTQAEVRSAVSIAVSPFREEAINAYAEAQNETKLPHYASRPVRIALVALLSAVAAGLAMCIVIKVPVHATAKTMVVDLGDNAPGDERGLSLVALFPSSARKDLDVGQPLRVLLPDTERRVRSDITYVGDEVLSPREIIRRFDLPEEQGNQVRKPAAVAVAELRMPDDAPPRASFEGAVIPQADVNVRTGTRRIISLVF
jgi:hypothetical protein